MEENPGPTIFDITDPTATVSADSIFVMSINEFNTKILTDFENEIKVSADNYIQCDEYLYKF